MSRQRRFAPRPKREQTLICDDCQQQFTAKSKNRCRDGILRCKRCRRKKDRALFTERHGPAHKVYAETQRPLARKWRLDKHYGMTPGDFDRMVEAQNGVCAICNSPPGRHPHLCIDHCHKTGKVRGLLCHKCNMVLGVVKDDVDTIQRLIRYLENSIEEETEMGQRDTAGTTQSLGL